ncbi:NAD(P)H-quinone oxidoreductase [Solicola gregarius]|uniref:NAD(P)H-quinone oxidoreductase n=1 Tax=Solicola gregarius TaxID=2908642 RepID=A0AA46YM32_9ACTN|nr:NAD(P)H-quinone oxidoreductase [Solicola gregarius]UYM07605.1 NAD(P)H-quinone oxidoreductase [Solicola gregarius]
MRAVIVSEPGGVDALELVDRDAPTPDSGEVVIDVEAAGVNRPDLAQRMGNYSPPPGVTDILGLECAGTISAVGGGVEDWQVGDPVCALVAGGAYAEQVAVPAGQVLPLPAGVSTVEAASLVEVACTVWSNVFMLAGLRPDEVLLVHGGGSGIGTMAIQLGRALGARVAVTAGSAEKLAACRDLGADITVNYREQDFVEVVREATDGHGADVILDIMGAKYLPRNIDTLATSGRLAVIGMQGGVNGELNIGTLLRKRAAIIGTMLRPRPVAEKAAIVESVRENVWPLVADGAVRPIVHATFPLDRVRDAHQTLEDSSHIGKVLLTT